MIFSCFFELKHLKFASSTVLTPQQLYSKFSLIPFSSAAEAVTNLNTEPTLKEQKARFKSGELLSFRHSETFSGKKEGILAQALILQSGICATITAPRVIYLLAVSSTIA